MVKKTKTQLISPVTKNDFESLLEKFEKDYIDYYKKQIEKFRNKYSNLTNQNRRTKRALKNICFFIWYSTEGEKSKVFDILFMTFVLLWAQDDFFDNVQVSFKNKYAFYSICNRLLENKQYKVSKKYNQQFQELVSLWRIIIQTMKKFSSRHYNYWRKIAQEMNSAMSNETYGLKNEAMSFEEYMEIANRSIGTIFIGVTYFVIKGLSVKTLKILEDGLLKAAIISRLSNDIASYKGNKNKINAVNVTRHRKNPEKYIFRLIGQERQKMNRILNKLNVEPWVKQSIQRSTEFLINFYKDSNFANKM